MEDLQGGTLALEHRYDLERRTREFALVTVYRGTQHPFDRPVWVKVCEAPHSLGSPELYERLKRSLVDAARFRHRRVANVVDFGDIDTHVAFWVVERVDGSSLDEYLERHGTLAPDEALEIALRVAEVLAEAHEAGLVHGGIAPRWITITDDGVHLDHFAMQPTMHEIRKLDGVILSQDLLWSLPPEQFGDDECAHREAADVWALGALLYWMVSGVHPHLDDPTDTSEAVLRLRNGAPPPSLEELGFDARLSEFVDLALHSDPSERHSSMRAFIAAAPVTKTPSAAAPQRPQAPIAAAQPTAPPRRGPLQGAIGTGFALALVLLLLSNLGWFFLTTSRESNEPTANLPAGGPEILPVGVQLDTVPEGAKILRIDGANETEFGDTPLTLDPKALPENVLPLVIRKRGHRDVRLDVKSVPDGHLLTVHLPPEGEQAASE